METLRLGSTGDLVSKWQTFLRGKDLYRGETSGSFDQATQDATKAYQTAVHLVADGVAGNSTLGKAMAEGFSALDDDESIYDDAYAGQEKSSPAWPPIPSDLTPASLAVRYQLFGQFQFTPDPTPANPEGIKILGSWVRDNIIGVDIPQLKGVRGAGNGKILFHAAGAPQLQALFAAWEEAGLTHLITSWAGSWAPRFIRGSTTTLSNHAWGTAFDINSPENGLGQRPALVGMPGSVRELVPIANEHGFFWGGHYRGSNGMPGRLDGMHFELVRVD